MPQRSFAHLRLAPAALVALACAGRLAASVLDDAYLLADLEPRVASIASSAPSLVGLRPGLALLMPNRDGHLEAWRTNGLGTGTYRLAGLCGQFCGEAFDAGAYSLMTSFSEGGADIWRTDGTPAGTHRLVTGNVQEVLGRAGTTGFTLLRVSNHGGTGQLWRTDGTAEGTEPVGVSQFEPSSAWVDATGVYYVADDPAVGRELFRTDGTVAGTQLVRNISRGRAGSNPHGFQRLASGWVVFIATERNGSDAIWRSDGTPEGTARVIDLNPGSARTDYETPLRGSSGGHLAYFVAFRGSVSSQLFRTDGTAAGTIQLTRFTDRNLFLEDITVVGDRAYAATRNPNNEGELWTSDGTSEGTARLAVTSSFPTSVVRLGSKVLFTGNDSRHGQEPWVSDGTQQGTRLVKDLCPGTCSSNRTSASTWGSALALSLDDGRHGLQLWRTDGTRRGTQRLTDLPGGVSTYFLPVSVGDSMLFTGDDGQHGIEPWVSRGTIRSTKLLADIDPGVVGVGSGAIPLFALGDKVIVSGSIDGHATVWRVGLQPGDSAALWTSPDPAPPYLGVALDNTSGLFLARSADGSQPAAWVTDGTPAGTHELTTVPDFTYPVADGNGRAFLTGDGLLVTDGTSPGTFRVLDSAARIDSSCPLVVLDGSLYFAAFAPGEADSFPWVSNGTLAGTRRLSGLATNPSDLRIVGDRVLFNGSQGQPWVSDGTEAGTQPLSVLPSGFIVPSFLPGLIDRNTYLRRSDQPSQLIASDSTASGTRVVHDFASPDGDGRIDGGVVLNEKLLLWIRESGGESLWALDPAASATVRLATDVPLPTNYAPAYAVLPDLLVYLGADGTLWGSDGTPQGTGALQLLPDPAARPAWLQAYGDKAVVLARDQVEGRGGVTMWTSDGTAAGTARRGVFDFLPGNLVGFHGALLLDDTLVFAVPEVSHGLEPWALRLP